jgi:wobble nucleotide-excising tRNase
MFYTVGRRETFADVSADEERLVGEHDARHQMQARGETWLAEGLRYVAEEECPFCGHDLAGVLPRLTNVDFSTPSRVNPRRNLYL